MSDPRAEQTSTGSGDKTDSNTALVEGATAAPAADESGSTQASTPELSASGQDAAQPNGCADPSPSTSDVGAGVGKAPVEVDPERERLELLGELKRRCGAAKIEFEEFRMYDGRIATVVRLRAGRDVRPLRFYRTEDIRALLEQPFEKYLFIGNYAAICSYEFGTIEAVIRTLSPPTSLHRLFEARGEVDEEGEAEQPFELHQSPDGMSLTLGMASDLLSLLDQGRPRFRDRRPLAIKLQRLNIKTHEQALEVLEKVANSFFFQTDITRGVLPTLVTQRPLVRSGFTRSRPEPPPALEFPRTEFDRAPLSLYFYARSAYGMPLLQFLAYYQVIEFYYPVYSQAEAQRRIRDIIKSPAFRADRDADIGRILGVVRGSGPSLGDERSQLRATINECVDPRALQEYLTHEERLEFFSSKKHSVAKHLIPLKAPNVEHADLRNDVAERIYEIRCKIVHTKRGAGDVDVELLLPFSPEAEGLHHDIELVQFIAREVLIAASSPLKISSPNVGAAAKHRG